MARRVDEKSSPSLPELFTEGEVRSLLEVRGLRRVADANLRSVTNFANELAASVESSLKTRRTRSGPPHHLAQGRGRGVGRPEQELLRLRERIGTSRSAWTKAVTKWVLVRVSDLVRKATARGLVQRCCFPAELPLTRENEGQLQLLDELKQLQKKLHSESTPPPLRSERSALVRSIEMLVAAWDRLRAQEELMVRTLQNRRTRLPEDMDEEYLYERGKLKHGNRWDVPRPGWDRLVSDEQRRALAHELQAEAEAAPTTRQKAYLHSLAFKVLSGKLPTVATRRLGKQEVLDVTGELGELIDVLAVAGNLKVDTCCDQVADLLFLFGFNTEAARSKTPVRWKDDSLSRLHTKYQGEVSRRERYPPNGRGIGEFV